MLTTVPPPTAPLTVTALPPTEAYDYDYYRARLAEPGLLDDAVAVRVFRAPLLAVPVGGHRRGGYMSFDLLVLAVAAKEVLDGRPGFPKLHVRWSPYRDTCHVVEWGEDPPDDDAQRGRFYGYSAEAISSFLDSRATTTPSSAHLTRSPSAL